MLQESADFELGATSPAADQPITPQHGGEDKKNTTDIQQNRPIYISDSDSDSLVEADDEKEDEYEGIEHNVFKTSNRLYDDMLTDLVFMFSDNIADDLRGGILRLPGIKYSYKLNLLTYNPYELYFPTGDDGFIEEFDSLVNPNDKVKVIRGVIFSNQEPTLSKQKIYHVRIAIKTKALTEKSVSKNLFHFSELSEDDAIDLLRSTTARDTDPKEMKDCAPKLLDSASYVCSLTKKVMRIEISEPEFDENDLHDYEIGPIKIRQHKIYSALGLPVPGQDPSPSQCLYTLFRVMRGPVQAQPGSELKTIGAENRSLITQTNPDLLIRKLHFRLENNEYFPPEISDLHVRSQALVRECFLRQMLEVAFLGTKAYSAGKPNPFKQIKFDSGKATFFRALDDMASVSHHRLVNEEDFVNLSVYPFYSDDLIQMCYEKMIAFDPSNQPVYYDSLSVIGKRKSNLKLNKFIKSLNVIGQKEINSAYRDLSLTPEDGTQASDEMILTLYKDARVGNLKDDNLRNSLRIISTSRNSEKLSRYLRYEPMDLEEANRILQVSDATEDEMLVTVFTLLSEESEPSQYEKLTRAFVTSAIHRSSPLLLSTVEATFPDIVEKMTFPEACHYIALDTNATEEQAITLFEMAVSSLNPLKARSALRIIGEHVESKLIPTYLETGVVNRDELLSKEWPVGLLNQGNTCYLNSLIQYYFAIKPFRDAVLEFNDVYNGEDIYKNRRIGGRLVGEDEIERSFQFTYYLRNLFYDMIHTTERNLAPNNALQFLAFASTMTKIEFTEDESALTSTDPKVEELSKVEEAKSARSSLELIDLSQDEDDGDEAMPDQIPEKKSSKPKAANISKEDYELAIEMGRQQDVTECIGNVSSQIEASWKPQGFDKDDGEQLDLLKELFYGKTVQHLVRLSDSSDKRDQIARYSWLLVNINDHPRNLYDALDSSFMTKELVETDSGQYQRTENIVSLPKILQIQIQRVGYNVVRQEAFKNNDQIPLPETIYMDRYMDTEDPEVLKKRSEVQQWKNEILLLKKKREQLLVKNKAGMTYKDSMMVTRDWLISQELADEATVEVLNKQIKKIDGLLMGIFDSIAELELKIDHQFDSYKTHAYNLFALFIHKGQANFGHYFIYIKDRERNMWRKYNDLSVTKVLEGEALNFMPGNENTPYFVAYVREGCEDMLDPVCRQFAQGGN